MAYYGYKQSDAEENTLNTLKGYFQKGSQNILYQAWKSAAINDFAFYDGVGQYPPQILKKLRERGQDPIVINKVASRINKVSGVEIQSRFRFAFRSHTKKEEEETLAKALTHLGYFTQEEQKIPYKQSLKFRDMMICGLGWGNLSRYQDGKIYYDYVHPLNIIFDANDFSPQLTESQFVICLRWLACEQIKLYWPKKAQRFKNYFDSTNNPEYTDGFSGELFNRNSAYGDSYDLGNESGNSRIKVIEVQYKRKKNYFRGLDLDGHPFETFNEEEALQLAGSKNSLEERAGIQVMRGVFAQDVLLEYGPLDPNLPNRKDFSYIPCVWQRRTSDGVPVGWLNCMKDVQRETNYRKLKEIENLYSVRVVMDANAIIGMTPNEIAEIVSNPNAVVIKTPGSELVVQPNQELAMGYIKASERTDLEIQQVSGSYDESLGAQTNATSGIAIERRQIASATTNVMAFDNLKMMKEREGQLFLDIIQGGGYQDLRVQILDEDEYEELTLNLAGTISTGPRKGQEVILNDIRTLPLTVYVEEVRDFTSRSEEERANLESLLANPGAALFLQNKPLLKMLHLRYGEEIADAAQEQQEKQQILASQLAANKNAGNNPSSLQGQVGDPTALFRSGIDNGS